MSLTRVTRFGFVNAFLVEEEDGLTLVDTAIPGSAKAILAAAAELGRPIVRIALTHAHGDHIGSLDALAEPLPGVEVAISTRDARLLAKNKTTDPGEPPEAKMRGSYPGAKTQPTRTLSPGDRVGSLEVIAAPGHTPGHVAFLDTRDRTLIAGDAFSTLGGVATSAKVNPRFPLPGHRDLAQADRARDRPRPARPRPGPPRGRPRPDRRRARRRDGRSDREAPRRALGRFGDVRREQRVVAAEARDRVRDGEEGLGVDAHAAVRGADLDELVGLGVQARAPLHDAVAARVHRDVADVVRDRRLDRGPEVLAARRRAGS